MILYASEFEIQACIVILKRVAAILLELKSDELLASTPVRF